MDFGFMGFDSRFSIRKMMENSEDAQTSINPPSRTYVRDAKAMAATQPDVKEYPNSYVFVVDMPGLKSGDIKVQVEDDDVLLISGERKREERKEDRYVRMERWVGKSTRKFVLPENANTGAISAACKDGVLTVTVQKLPPPEPKKPMAATDVKECPNSYVLVVDMPGLKSGDIKVQVEDGDVLLISGERKREERKEDRYVRMERWVGKSTRKFVLPENDNTGAISAACQDGVLTVTVQKLPLPEPKKPMAATPADVKEYPNSCVFVVDMPGLKSDDITVQVKDNNVLLISGERKREETEEVIRYVRKERWVGKFKREFELPRNPDTGAISAACQDGVLTVTVQKLPQPELDPLRAARFLMDQNRQPGSTRSLPVKAQTRTRTIEVTVGRSEARTKTIKVQMTKTIEVKNA